MSPALAGGFLTTVPPGKSQHSVFEIRLCCYISVVFPLSQNTLVNRMDRPHLFIHSALGSFQGPAFVKQAAMSIFRSVFGKMYASIAFG